MAAQTLSLILYTAFQTLQPCATVFEETAKAANPSIDFKVEQAYLTEFAEAACETSNPDILWLIAQQESNFRFTIVRENGSNPNIYKGKEAVAFLKQIKAEQKQDPSLKKNVDIGVLQFNWNWHQEGFQNNPLVALSPRKQVDYFLKRYSQEIYKRCDKSWVGCYHNQADLERATNYQKGILKKNKVLAEGVLTYLRDYRLSLSQEERALLPAFRKDEFFKVYKFVQTFPLPRKQIMHFADEGDLRLRDGEADI